MNVHKFPYRIQK